MKRPAAAPPAGQEAATKRSAANGINGKGTKRKSRKYDGEATSASSSLTALKKLRSQSDKGKGDAGELNGKGEASNAGGDNGKGEGR